MNNNKYNVPITVIRSVVITTVVRILISRKEGNVLFNDTMGNKYYNPLNTRNYRLYVPSEINFTQDR